MSGLDELARFADRAYYALMTFGILFVLIVWSSWRRTR